MFKLLVILVVSIFFQHVSADTSVEAAFILLPGVATAFMFSPEVGDLDISVTSIFGFIDITVLPETQYYLMLDGDPYYDYPAISETYVQAYSWTGPFVGDETYNWIVLETQDANGTDAWVFIDWIDYCEYGNSTASTEPRHPRTEPVFFTKAVYPTQAFTKHIEKVCSTQVAPDCPPQNTCAGHVAISLSAISLWFLSIAVGGTYYFLLKKKEASLGAATAHRDELASI